MQFSYSDQEAWKTLPHSECGGVKQSPIDIVISEVEFENDISRSNLYISYLNDSFYGTWENNGHALKFTPADCNIKYLHSFLNRGEYKLLQFHFHWGSEHRVNGRQYSGELHLVHKSYTAEKTDFDYYTVVGVFLEADDQLYTKGTIWEEFSKIPDFGESVDIFKPDLSYNALFPDSLEYYYYNGSLTTPLCNQIVQWIVLDTPIRVPSSFLQAARTMKQEDGESLEANFRNTQPVNGRKVYATSEQYAKIPC